MAVIDSTADAFLGKGIIFPIALDTNGRVKIDGGKALIEASLRAILSWNIGTRFFLGEYGAIMEQILQEPNDASIKAIIKHFIQDPIEKWEPRVELLDAQFISKEDWVLNIQLKYRIRNTKIEDTFIYPYYSQLKY